MPTEEYIAHYQTGFNDGYRIAKHLPELSEKLAQVKSNSPRLEGLLDGIEQYTHELTKEWTPTWRKHAQEKDIEHDKDEKEIEPDN